jgi:hypothetical protein
MYHADKLRYMHDVKELTIFSDNSKITAHAPVTRRLGDVVITFGVVSVHVNDAMIVRATISHHSDNPYITTHMDAFYQLDMATLYAVVEGLDREIRKQLSQLNITYTPTDSLNGP